MNPCKRDCKNLEDCDSSCLATQAIEKAMGIGDVTATTKGSAARYNGGKPRFELLPLRQVANYYGHAGTKHEGALQALRVLADWQERRGNLWEASEALGDVWDECAHGFAYGEKKYAAWNWTRGQPWSVPMASCARHLRKLIQGHVIDVESEVPHIGLAECNLVMLRLFAVNYPEGDDRPPAGTLGQRLVPPAPKPSGPIYARTAQGHELSSVPVNSLSRPGPQTLGDYIREMDVRV